MCVRVVGLRLRLRGGILMWRMTVDESGMMGWKGGRVLRVGGLTGSV